MRTIADSEGPAVEDPHATLERALIAEFLGDMGYTLHSLEDLPPDQHRDVLRFAMTYATLSLGSRKSKRGRAM